MTFNAPGSHLSGACFDCGAGGLDAAGLICRTCNGLGLIHPYPDH
ncbi:hypothetical protein [Actinomadura graeca]|nr:hypothetical protein [Actinomadura graeca]